MPLSEQAGVREKPSQVWGKPGFVWSKMELNMVEHQRPGEAFAAGTDKGRLQMAALGTPLKICAFTCQTCSLPLPKYRVKQFAFDFYQLLFVKLLQKYLRKISGGFNAR